MIINIILIISLLLLFVDFFFVNYLWMNFNDQLFNIFNLLLIVLFLVFVVFAIIKLYVLVYKKNIKMLSFGLVIILLIGIGTILSTNTKEQQVICLTNISAKETDEKGNCFLVLNNLELKKFVRIKCDKETFHEIETSDDTLYTVNYRIGFFHDDYGILGDIEEYTYDDFSDI